MGFPKLSKCLMLLQLLMNGCKREPLVAEEHQTQILSVSGQGTSTRYLNIMVHSFGMKTGKKPTLEVRVPLNNHQTLPSLIAQQFTLLHDKRNFIVHTATDDLEEDFYKIIIQEQPF